MSGDCFTVAAQLQAADPTLMLVHGTVVAVDGSGTAKAGQRHWHAWVERKITMHHPNHPDRPIVMTTCIDKANGNDMELPAQLYYKLGLVRDARWYTREEACIHMLREEHWGPWETATRYDPDQNVWDYLDSLGEP